MVLKNPNFNYKGEFDCPNNVYTCDDCKVIPIKEIVDGQIVIVSTTVILSLKSYKDDTSLYNLTDTTFFLTGLTTDRSLLNPELYQTELISQHGSEVVDGTELSSFEVLS